MSPAAVTGPRVLGPAQGLILGAPEATDRFMLDSAETTGRLAIVEHTIAPGVLAAPMHRHEREDEYSYVLEGRVGAIFDGVEVYATAGDFVRKPRGEWHTFWNAGDGPLRILEIITPGGLEELFRLMGSPGASPDLLEDVEARSAARSTRARPLPCSSGTVCAPDPCASGRSPPVDDRGLSDWRGDGLFFGQDPRLRLATKAR